MPAEQRAISNVIKVLRKSPLEITAIAHSKRICWMESMLLNSWAWAGPPTVHAIASAHTCPPPPPTPLPRAARACVGSLTEYDGWRSLPAGLDNRVVGPSSLKEGRACHAERLLLDPDKLFVFALVDKKIHGKLPRLVAKGLHAPVVGLLILLVDAEFCSRTRAAQFLELIVTLDSANLVQHNHGLNNGIHVDSLRGGVPLQTETRHHQRDASAGDLREKVCSLSLV